MHPCWLHDLDSLEAISQDADARRMLTRLANIAQAGRTDAFLLELAIDDTLDGETKSMLREIARDPLFLAAVQDYFVQTGVLQ
jgi:hypothetical protein